VGSLEPGKDADIVLFSDDPLTLAAKPVMVFASGRTSSATGAPGGRRSYSFDEFQKHD